MARSSRRTCGLAGCDSPARASQEICTKHKSRMARTGRYSLETPEERALSRVRLNPDTGCLLWQGTVNRGTPALSVGGQNRSPARVIYEGINGAIADDTYLYHECGQSICVNPAHLVPAPRGHTRT